MRLLLRVFKLQLRLCWVYQTRKCNVWAHITQNKYWLYEIGAWQKRSAEKEEKKQMPGRPRLGERAAAGFLTHFLVSDPPRPQGLPGVPGHLHFLFENSQFAYVNFFKVQFKSPCSRVYTLLLLLSRWLWCSSPLQLGGAPCSPLTSPISGFLTLFFPLVI